MKRFEDYQVFEKSRKLRKLEQHLPSKVPNLFTDPDQVDRDGAYFKARYTGKYGSWSGIPLENMAQEPGMKLFGDYI